MATKSPTVSVRSREIIGVDQFSQRREVFGKHDTVFMPLPSPTTLMPATEVDPIVTSNHGKTTSNFKRNTPLHSSMRETTLDDRLVEFRTRKYSDNYTSEVNQSDDVDYRTSMNERNRKLSKLRREFLKSNLHDPAESPFTRNGLRASLPASSFTSTKYKVENLNIHKFPFFEPFGTPSPTRRVFVDLGPVDDADGKENQDPQVKTKHSSLTNSNSPSKIDHQKLFEELVKRYSPQRKPVDWNLPPTKPRVVGSIPKSTSSMSEADKGSQIRYKSGEDDVFAENKNKLNDSEIINHEVTVQLHTVTQNGTDKVVTRESASKTSASELDETKDLVPELSTIQSQIKRDEAKKALDHVVDLTIPALIKKMTEEGEDLESHTKKVTKVKRKRSFIDKLLGRKKEK